MLAFARKQGLIGPSALKQSDQVKTNWGTRGVNIAGSIADEKRFGCTAIWVLEGVNSPSATTAEVELAVKPSGG